MREGKVYPISDSLLSVAAANPRVEHFRCNGWVSPKGFYRLLSKTNSLTSIIIELGESNYSVYSNREKNLFWQHVPKIKQ